MNYSETEGFTFNQLEVNIIKQGYSWALVNITDNKKKYVHSTILEVFLHGIKINAIIENLNEGLYNITLDSSYIDEELIIVAKKSGWLSNSARVILGSLEVVEEPKSMIFGYLPIILILCIIGISFLVRLPNRKNFIKSN